MKPTYTNTLLRISLLGILCLIATGCSNLFEESLNEKQVVVILPKDSITSSVYKQVFWWEHVEGAISYHLQIVSPSFESAQTLVIDSVINTTKFEYSFQPGNYQWRIRAQNASSASAYRTYNLNIDPSPLENQVVLLTSPTDEDFVRSAQVRFSWQPLFNASKYRIQLSAFPFDENNLVTEKSTTTNSYTHDLPEGNYQWRVRGEANDGKISQWSAIYSFTYDVSPPEAVSLVTPSANQVLTSKTTTLKWNSVPGALSYKLYIYKDNGNTLLNSTFPVTVTTNKYDFNAGTATGDLYWQVKAVDRAGNESDFSELWKFKVP
jgi:hypothetical protein